MIALEIDYSVDKFERNFDKGYAHVDATGKHWQKLPTDGVIEALDGALAYQGINEPSVFMKLLYHVTGHQTYHVAIDDDSTLTYHGIAQILDRGKGNPRLDKLELLLQGHGASLAVCRVQDREDDVVRGELQRACFFQQLVGKERWPLKTVIDLLFEHGLQLRVFSLEEVTQQNWLRHQLKVDVTKPETYKETRSLLKSIYDLSSLIGLFNVYGCVTFTIEPPAKRKAAK